MYILDVIPLALIPRHQDQLLSYYHTSALPVGAVVETTLNRRKIQAVVVGSDTIKNRKLLFKKSVDFELKNITKVISTEPLVSERQLTIAKYLSDYYYAPLGVCLKTILPPFFLKRGYGYHLKPITYNLPQRFILIPEKILGEYYKKKYQADAFISGATKSKEYFAIWEKIAKGEAITVVGTRVGLFLPFQNLTELVVEDEANEAYKSDMTPRYHAVDVATFIANLHKAKITYQSPLPRLPARGWPALGWEIRNPKFSAKVVNMISEIKAANFSIFSRDLKDFLLKAISHKLKAILYIPRRGHANFLTCEHCSQIVKCPNCSASLVLHHLDPTTQNLKPVLICHHCSHSQTWPKTCVSCDAHKFKSYGIGIEKVESDLKKFFKYLNIEAPRILRLDSDSVPNEETEQKIISDFRQSDTAILVATQMLFSQRELIKADVCGIISADTLINIPDFRAEEALFRQIYTLGTMAKELIIQTRNPDDPAIQLAAKGDTNSFFTSELATRQDFNYPPFSQLVKLTYRHRDNYRAQKEATTLFERLRYCLKIRNLKLEISLLGPSPAFISPERGQYVWNIIIKLKRKAKSEKEEAREEIKKRNELLRLVPTGWVIDVDPRNII